MAHRPVDEPALTATVDGTPLLRPLIAQWDSSLGLILDRLDGLRDEEYRWLPTPDAADLVADGPDTVRAAQDADQSTRTIAWTLAHLAQMCWVRADYTDGEHCYSLDYVSFPGDAADGLAEFRAAAARWRKAVTRASEEQALQVGYSSYPRGMDPDLPFVDIVWWVNRELIAHGADMATVRDLYAARGAAR